MTIDQTFSTVISAEVLKQFEQEGSKVMANDMILTTDKPGMNSYSRVIYRQGSAYTGKPRGSFVTFNTENPDVITWEQTSYTAPHIIDDYDAAKQNFSAREVIVSEISDELGVAFDMAAVGALDLTPNTITPLPTAATLDFKGMAAIKRREENDNVFRDGKMMGLIRPYGEEDLSTDAAINNAYHFQNAIQATGHLPMVSGHKLVTISDTMLKVATAGHYNYFFRKDAVEAVFTIRPKVQVSYENLLLANVAIGVMQVGIKIVRRKGTYKTDIDNA